MSELDDAIIEDTIHCDFCGVPWTAGGNEDGICVNAPFARAISPQLKLCLDCAAFVSLTLKQRLQEKDICEHGVCVGDWCEPCNRAYKEADLRFQEAAS